MKILACNGNITLAKKIVSLIGQDLVNATIGRFADGEVSVEIHETVRGEDVFLIQSMGRNVNENIVELLVSLDSLRRSSCTRVTAVIPYFGYSRQDRKTYTRTPISAKLLANLITASGADRVLTLDIHTEQIQGFFDIPMDNLYAAPLFIKKIKTEIDDLKNLVIVSPDVGGIHKARYIAKKIGCNLAVIDKRREGAGLSEVMNVIGDVKGKNAVIIDDLIDSGGTLCNAAKAIIDNGSKSVDSYITHGVLTGKAIQNINDSVIRNLYLTNSIDISNKIQEKGKIKVIDIAPLFAEAIKRIAIEESVSTLFN